MTKTIGIVSVMSSDAGEYTFIPIRRHHVFGSDRVYEELRNTRTSCACVIYNSDYLLQTQMRFRTVDLYLAYRAVIFRSQIEYDATPAN